MKYLTCTSQGQTQVFETQIPQAGSGEIIVQLVFCGVCGTDTEKIFGAYPKPQKLGHEVVATVYQLGKTVTQFEIGQRVALAHHVPDHNSHYAKRGSETMDADFKSSNIEPGGFSQFIRVPAPHVANTVVAIPDHVPNERAVFMEPLACCLRAWDRMNLEKGDSALVVGVGAVGILFVPLLCNFEVTVLVTDIRAERIELAKSWGAKAGSTRDVPNMCKSHSEARGVDAVILTIVNAATITLALQAVRDGGTLMIFGGKPESQIELPMWDIWLREINLITSYSATPKGLHRAMALLRGKAFEGFEALISHKIPLAKAQSGFELAHIGQASKVVITP